MKTVLLIDDDSDDREIFEESLLSLAADVKYEEATNGKHALEKLNSVTFNIPDLIFLDLNMPIMDGREFLKKIKQNQLLSQIPVIIYSTSSNAADKEFAKQNKAAMFMTKQYSIKILQTELREALTKFLDL